MKKFEFFLLLGLLCLCPELSAQHIPTRVFPTPQEIEVTNQPFISADFRITGLKSVDSVAISFLKEILPFGSTKKAIPIKISLLKDKQAVLLRIPVDTRSPIPVISVHSVCNLQYRWQS